MEARSKAVLFAHGWEEIKASSTLSGFSLCLLPVTAGYIGANLTEETVG
jgi:hypothetical protein